MCNNWKDYEILDNVTKIQFTVIGQKPLFDNIISGESHEKCSNQYSHINFTNCKLIFQTVWLTFSKSSLTTCTLKMKSKRWLNRRPWLARNYIHITNRTRDFEKGKKWIVNLCILNLENKLCNDKKLCGKKCVCNHHIRDFQSKKVST